MWKSWYNRRRVSLAASRRAWPHLLRHSRHTQIREDGANAYEIKEVVVHHTLEIGAKYVHLSEQSVRDPSSFTLFFIVESSYTSNLPMNLDLAKAERAMYSI